MLIKIILAGGIVTAALVGLFTLLPLAQDSGFLTYVDKYLGGFNVSISSDGRESLQPVSLDEGRELSAKVGFIADAEGNTTNLVRALDRLEDLSVDGVFFLGDLTRWGSAEELLEVKEVLDGHVLEIFVIPGDHDLAASVAAGDSSGKANFQEVFNETNSMHVLGGYKFLLFDNSPNFTPLDQRDLLWFEENVSQADFVLLSQPLYHPTSARIMGVVDGRVVSTVREQSLHLLSLVRAGGVRAVIAADRHMFSDHPDSERPLLRHISLGALVSNDEYLRNPQAPRFGLLEVYSDGSFKFKDIVL